MCVCVSHDDDVGEGVREKAGVLDPVRPRRLHAQYTRQRLVFTYTPCSLRHSSSCSSFLQLLVILPAASLPSRCSSFLQLLAVIEAACHSSSCSSFLRILLIFTFAHHSSYHVPDPTLTLPAHVVCGVLYHVTNRLCSPNHVLPSLFTSFLIFPRV